MQNERGNVFVYVLIAVVLFAALTFILTRQEDEKEINVLTPEKAKIIATQMITTATQVKSALDQMVFAGTDPSDFDFALPGAFGAAPHTDKVFHPDGGGILLPPLPKEAVGRATADPVNGWYLGSFNNVEWTPSTADDVILNARSIDKTLCEELNKMISGSDDIPVLSGELRVFLIDDSLGSFTNQDLTIVSCPDCEPHLSLCVQNNAQNAYSFYNVVVAR